MSQSNYHVFLNFYGDGSSKTFVGHLYTELGGAGFRTFRADSIERGENTSRTEWEEAIRDSRVSLIVLSKDYASSAWCLDELVIILGRKRASKHVVLPVFYDVDPSHVRKQKESFAKAFNLYEDKVRMESDQSRKEYWRDKLEGWRAALKEVADLGGFVLENQADRHESKFIQIILEDIVNKLHCKALNVTGYLTGIESYVEDISRWLQCESNVVSVIVISGMGGIGKTTISKTVYNRNLDKFDGSSFLANIREASKQANGLVRLQRQLLADVLNRKKEIIHSVDEGIIKIKDAMCCKRILVVLDDVDQLDQVNAIFGSRNWLHPGSKIIITTRHEQLLKPHERCKTYPVEELSDEEALQLFSWHAFGQDHPVESYIAQSKRIIQHCGGLPLALAVLGSSLFGENVDVWDSALAKLATYFDEKIHDVLKTSYHSLDDHEKCLFLDIVSFFLGKDKDYVVRTLEEYDFPVTVGIQNLISRGLLKVNEFNKLMMHPLLREMGREIIRRESIKEPGKRSRVWHHNDALYVLTAITGTETIEGLSLLAPKEDMPAKRANNAQPPHCIDFVGKSVSIYEENSSKRRQLGLFSWLPGFSVLANSLSGSELNLPTAAFSQMQRLRLLQLNGVRLTGSYEEFPRRLRWLCWRGCPLKSMPIDFPLENVVVLDLRYSNLEQLWKGTKFLRSLKILNISHCFGFTTCPDFSQLPNLERLILKHCVNLVGLHESLAELRKLVLLNLKGCKNLRKLPEEVAQLKALEKLIISGCSRLKKLPSDICKTETLKVVHEDYSGHGKLMSWYGPAQLMIHLIHLMALLATYEGCLLSICIEVIIESFKIMLGENFRTFDEGQLVQIPSILTSCI